LRAGERPHRDVRAGERTRDGSGDNVHPGVSGDALKRISRRRTPAHGCAGRRSHHGWFWRQRPPRGFARCE